MAKVRGAPPLSRITLLRDRVDDWHTFPFNVRAVATLDELDVRERVLFFVGENGSGKSTLLEAIALSCGFGPEGGTRNLSFTTRVSAAPSIDDADAPTKRLSEALRLSWTRQRQRDGFFLRAESFHNFASELDRLERERRMGRSYLAPYGGTSLHDRSHGESFLTLFLERFSGRGLFLLDEPVAALSAARQLALIVRMNDLLVC